MRSDEEVMKLVMQVLKEQVEVSFSRPSGDLASQLNEWLPSEYKESAEFVPFEGYMRFTLRKENMLQYDPYRVIRATVRSFNKSGSNKLALVQVSEALIKNSGTMVRFEVELRYLMNLAEALTLPPFFTTIDGN